MKRFKIKTVSFITIVLIGLLLNPRIYLVNAKEDYNQEEIIILDKSKINIDDSRCFTIGDIDGDGISEVITFKSIKEDSGVQWIINSYHKDNNIWFPVLSKIYTEGVSGSIHKVDIGNFDKDDAQEIIIASWEDDTSKIYLFDFDRKQKEFSINIIYELDTYINDLEVQFNEGKSSDSIYVLFSDNIYSVEHFETNIILINKIENGFSSKMIYSESKIYWNLFSIGQFIKQKSSENQILLYRYETTNSIMEPAIIRIINSESELLMEDTNIGEYAKIRDIVAWDRYSPDVDELCMLETNNLGDDIGFSNKLIYCKFNHNGLLEKEEQLLDTTKILSQLCVGNLDQHDDTLLILDPYAGSLDYLRAFDDEAEFHYSVWGYNVINNNFNLFEHMLEDDVNIYVTRKANYYYTSSGSTASALLSDLVTKTSGARSSYGADIVTGVVMDSHSDWWVLGIAYRPGRYSILFAADVASDNKVLCHEVGHNYGVGHCSNFFCIMYSAWHIFTMDFCQGCESDFDKDKYGPPYPPPPPPPGGGGGGCPFLSVFDGTEYIGEGLLDIHDITGIDKVFIHTLDTSPSQLNNKVHLRLTEHPQTISDIDHIRLYGRLENGQWVSLQLKSAIHSTKGEVRKLLQFSDDLRVEELGADHNNGVSETIDLEFITDGEINFLEFRFIIEGNNYIVK